MDDSMTRLHQHKNPIDAGKSLPSRGADWDAAIESGIDVTLLLDNIRLTPAQRIARMDAMNRFAAGVQERTVPLALRQAMKRRRLAEKLATFGPEI